MLEMQEFRDAKKKFDIWKVPPVLIIHLKRFKYLPTGERRKMQTFVDFPNANWNLKYHVKSPQREKPIYDLYAVSNHHGGFGSGHYTAYCKARDMSREEGAVVRRQQESLHSGATSCSGAHGAIDGLGVMDWFHFTTLYEHVDVEDEIKSPSAYVVL